MGDVAIRVENLSKQYRIGQRTGYGMLRESFADRLHGRRTRRRIRGKMGHRDHIWALKDISFELERGGILGIIGSNGSGKSTLLKILSRITQPTSGRAEIRGRVGSLLEVGTGFHPELTGRENVYLSGNILGMRRAEIARKFDEIVEFSGVEQFIDTPVKRYSSGMAVRLGFAVAAHLEPEVLLVDEVLAVGDAAFQKKCSGKMGEEAKKGRTVLFVSHNMEPSSRSPTSACSLRAAPFHVKAQHGMWWRTILRGEIRPSRASLTSQTSNDSAQEGQPSRRFLLLRVMKTRDAVTLLWSGKISR